MTARRTYVENPDLFLSEYTIEDHLRDLQFNETKLKEFVKLNYKNFPGFIEFEGITQNIFRRNSMNIAKFIAIDGQANVIVFDGVTGLTPDQYQLDTWYYVTCKTSVKTTGDIRRNPNQSNKATSFILEEFTDINFKLQIMPDELCLGEIMFTFNESQEIEFHYRDDARSNFLQNIYEIYDLLTALDEEYRNRFVLNQIYPLGPLVKDLSSFQFNTLDLSTTKLLAINSDKTIDERFIDKDRIIDRLFKEIVLSPRTGSVGPETLLYIDNTKRNIAFYNDEKNVLAEFTFNENGSLNENEVSENVYTMEDAFYNNSLNSIYFSSSIINNLVEIRIQNNYNEEVVLKYRVR
jgi:hypothetical protein